MRDIINAFYCTIYCVQLFPTALYYSDDVEIFSAHYGVCCEFFNSCLSLGEAANDIHLQKLFYHCHSHTVESGVAKSFEGKKLLTEPPIRNKTSSVK